MKYLTRPTAPLWLGLTLTVLAIAAPLLDPVTLDAIAAHVRAAYPDWDAATVAMDRDAIVGYLVGVGVLGGIGWLWTMRGVAKNARWTRLVATTLFGFGAILAATTLSAGGENYEVIVPYGYGTLSALPVLAGLVALVAIWRRPAR